MFKFVQITPTSSDCTCGYDVVLDKEYTVKEFIETVLKERSNEWGYIGIYDCKSWFGNPKLEYRCRKLITEEKLETHSDDIIVEVTANGRWSRMDYLIKL